MVKVNGDKGTMTYKSFLRNYYNIMCVGLVVVKLLVHNIEAQ